MAKQITIDEAAKLVKDGMTIMIGGFMGCGSPHKIIDKLVESGVKNLSLFCNDTGLVDYGVGKMVVAKQFKKIYASHIGLNPEAGRQMTEKEVEIVLVPQGTLAERIRSAGAGLGGFLTPTGVGTTVQEGKEVITVEGKEYLLELPLKADIAIVEAGKADKAGNLQYHGSTKNFCELMVTAADITIAEVREVVETGEIDPDFVHSPGIFIDYIAGGN